MDLTYNGSVNAPINGGSYTVVGTINDPNYQGSATSTLAIVSNQTWTRTGAPNVDWVSVASSADGTKLVAVQFDDAGYAGWIYTSTDSGATWTRTGAHGYWASVASSIDGTKLVAAQARDGNGNPGWIYTSTDSGATWSPTGAPNSYWASVASSADGTKLVAAQAADANGNPGRIYTSTDSGATWTRPSAPNSYWASVASAADGATLVAAAGNWWYGVPGLIYTSTDSGAVWTATTSPTDIWAAVASSRDGTRMVAASASGGIYIWQYAPTPCSITRQPQSQTVLLGSAATFGVSASGSPSLNYQWQFNGANLTDNARIGGSQNNHLTIANVQAGDSGSYQVIITNTYGSITSAVAVLTATPPLAAESVTDNFASGNDSAWIHFDLGAAGQAPSTYSFPPDGAGGYAYRIHSPTPYPVTTYGSAQAYSYRANVYADFQVAADLVAWDNTLPQTFGLLARIRNLGFGQSCGYVFAYYSDPSQKGLVIYRITNEVPTGIATAAITLNPTHKYRLVATGAGSMLMGQVYDLSDLSTPLATVVATDGTYSDGVCGLFNYSLESNTDADVTFDNYSAQALLAPSIVVQPQSSTNVVGTSASFSMTAAGTLPLSYQWQFKGANLTDSPHITGARSNILTILNILAGDAGDYQVVVTNASSSATSAVASLTVNAAGTTNVVVSSSNPSLPGANVTFTATVGAVAPGSGIPTNQMRFLTNGIPAATNYLDANGLAAYSTTLLPHGSNTVSAQYVSDGNFLPSTNSVVQVVNTPPTASGFAMGGKRGDSATVAVIGGKHPPTDVDVGDAATLHITAVTQGSHGIVSTDGTHVTYTGTGGDSGTDSFTYIVSDRYGGTAVATVTVSLAGSGQGFNLVSVTPIGGGQERLTYLGVPGYRYALDRTDNLAYPIQWIPQATNLTDGVGQLIFTNQPDAATNNFWRTRYLP